MGDHFCIYIIPKIRCDETEVTTIFSSLFTMWNGKLELVYFQRETVKGSSALPHFYSTGQSLLRRNGIIFIRTQHKIVNWHFSRSHYSHLEKNGRWSFLHSTSSKQFFCSVATLMGYQTSNWVKPNNNVRSISRPIPETNFMLDYCLLYACVTWLVLMAKRYSVLLFDGT